MSLVYFVILVGVLIFVHELGHFIFAKLFDVKVLRFSIGFGPPIFTYEKGETEYVVAWLPLGGFVQMLGFNFESLDSIPESEKHRALMAKPIWQRSLITLAGPLFNFILPVLIFFVFTMGQTTAPPAKVGEILADTPAEKVGLQAGDKIKAINGQPIRYWHELVDRISANPSKEVSLTYVRNGQPETISVTPDQRTSNDFMGLHSEKYGMLGIQLPAEGTTIAFSADSPAKATGLDRFDRIYAVDGQKVKRFDALAQKLRQRRGQRTEITVLQRLPIDVDYGHLYRQDMETITVELPHQMPDLMGIESAEMYLTGVEPKSPAAEAGLQAGDKILAIDGQRYNSFSLLKRQIRTRMNEIIVQARQSERDIPDKGPELKVKYRRNGKTHTGSFEPSIVSFKDRGQPKYRIRIGWEHLSDTVRPEDLPFPFVERIVYAATTSVSKTYGVIDMMVKGLGQMFQGEVSLDTVGGPIMIGELAAQAGEAGWQPFLRMLALISINLGVINLLPIPVLDGGHLVLYGIEAVKRGPLSYRTRQIAAYIGVVLILLLMLLAFKNDIERNWQYIVELIKGG